MYVAFPENIKLPDLEKEISDYWKDNYVSKKMFLPRPTARYLHFMEFPKQPMDCLEFIMSFQEW